jgi:hypothetical protein
MDELAFRTLINNLETSRSSLHGLLHFFTWLVVVGLAFDLFVIIKEFRDDWGEFTCGQIHPYENHLPKRPNVSLLILALLGTALIVIGVAGELYVDVQAGKIETQIRGANDNLLGLIIQEAGDAKASADSAASAASMAGKEADKAQKKAGIVAKQADELRKRTSELATKLKAEESAEEGLRVNIGELEKIARPRVLAVKGLPDGKSNIDELKKFAGTEVLLVSIDNEEARRAAGSIKFILDSWAGAGWKVTVTVPVSTWTFPVHDGVSVQIPKSIIDGRTPELMKMSRAQNALVTFMTKSGWEEVIPGVSTDENPSHGLRVIVGFRPQPIQLLK